MKYFIYCRKSSEAEDRQIMSIESQREELEKVFANRPEIEIIERFEESKSAKSPGRTVFGAMLARIEKGEAAGIIAWAPDRLARNSIDGGRIVYLLDCQILCDLKFANCGFENTSQGKFMLQIMFGQSKYYSDALSENVKRGNRTKISHGWLPNFAPLGYLNDPATKTIVKDPVYFPFVQKMFGLMLTGAYSPREIAIIARDQWGFRTPKRRKIGGVPLAMSSIYKMLSNPFYAGLIVWNGETYPGKHEPIVSLAQFERIRSLLNGPTMPRPQRHTFAFTGLIQCGSCGLRITAEHKTNRYGRRYVYYHCTKRQLGPRCAEPSIELHSLESQIANFLSKLTLPATITAWITRHCASDRARLDQEDAARRSLLERARENTRSQLQELTGLRIRKLLTDDEFVARRQELQSEEAKFTRTLASVGSNENRFELFESLILFRNQAVNWFRRGDERVKRLILATVGSNLLLTNKILSIQAAKPFLAFAETGSRPRLLADVDEVRTFLAENEGRHILENITEIQRLVDQASVSKAA